jgi:CRP-like cAMP-binding protein
MVEMGASPAAANQLLAKLSPGAARQLLSGLQLVSLKHGEVLHQPGVPIPYVYFPCGGLISLFAPLGEDKEVEMAMVGTEGIVGISVYLGNTTTIYKALVQAPGSALRMKADAFRVRAARSKPLTTLLLRYADAFLAQVSLSGACNGQHRVAQRLCRWLLMAHDRIASDRLPFNQQFLARMLTVRLATVSEAASALKRAGLIHYGGDVRILNRRGLEEVCCGCYGMIKDRFASLALA